MAGTTWPKPEDMGATMVGLLAQIRYYQSITPKALQWGAVNGWNQSYHAAEVLKRIGTNTDLLEGTGDPV